MKHISSLSTITFLFFLNIHLFAQTKYSVGWHINPIISTNIGKSNGTLISSKYQFLDIGLESGLEFNYAINSNIIFTPVFKYYRVSQKIINKDFKNYLSEESYVWQKLSYENKDVGLLIKCIISKKCLLTFGTIYSMSTNNLLKWRNHYRGIENTNNLSAIGYKFNINDLGTKNNMLKICLGLRKDLTIKNLGYFEYGLLCYIPTEAMPKYRYDQILETTIGQINDYSNFSSSQFSTEISLIYKFINFDNDFKRVFRKMQKK